MIKCHFGKTILFQTKPKRKFLNHLNHGGREKGKRHEHTKQDVNRLEIYSRKTKVNGILLPIRTISSY